MHLLSSFHLLVISSLIAFTINISLSPVCTLSRSLNDLLSSSAQFHWQRSGISSIILMHLISIRPKYNQPSGIVRPDWMGRWNVSPVPANHIVCVWTG